MLRRAIGRHGRRGSQPLQFSASVCASLSLGLASARVPSRATSSCLSLSASSGVLFAAEQLAEDLYSLLDDARGALRASVRWRTQSLQAAIRLGVSGVVRRYAQLAADHLAPYPERFGSLKPKPTFLRATTEKVFSYPRFVS
jgi:hypothetical protein